MDDVATKPHIRIRRAADIETLDTSPFTVNRKVWLIEYDEINCGIWLERAFVFFMFYGLF